MKIRYYLNHEDLAAYSWFCYKKVPLMNKKYKETLELICLIALVICLLYYVQGGSVSCFAIPIFIGVVCLFFYFGGHRKPLFKQIKQLYPEGKDINIICEHHMEIREEALLISSRYLESKIKFEGIIDIKQSDTHTFVYLTLITAYIIPKANIVEGDYEAFISLLKEKFEQVHKPTR